MDRKRERDPLSISSTSEEEEDDGKPENWKLHGRHRGSPSSNRGSPTNTQSSLVSPHKLPENWLSRNFADVDDYIIKHPGRSDANANANADAKSGDRWERGTRSDRNTPTNRNSDVVLTSDSDSSGAEDGKIVQRRINGNLHTRDQRDQRDQREFDEIDSQTQSDTNDQVNELELQGKGGGDEGILKRKSAVSRGNSGKDSVITFASASTQKAKRAKYKQNGGKHQKEGGSATPTAPRLQFQFQPISQKIKNSKKKQKGLNFS